MNHFTSVNINSFSSKSLPLSQIYSQLHEYAYSGSMASQRINQNLEEYDAFQADKIESQNSVSCYMDNTSNNDCDQKFKPNITKLQELANIPNFNDYTIFKVIGQGSHGIVLLIYSIERMVKFCPLSIVCIKFEFQKNLREIEFWDNISHMDINHNYIIDKGIINCTQQLYKLFLANSPYPDYQSYLFEKVGYMIMNACECDLSNILDNNDNEQFSKSNVIYLLYSITKQLHYYFQKGITHRDIKPNNILIIHGVAENTIDYILSDFSLWSKVTNNTKLPNNIVGTIGYIAPEIASSNSYKENNLVYDPFKADVYSLGLTCFEMLIDKQSRILIKNMLKSGNFQDIMTKIDILISDLDLKKLFKRILDPNPITRLSIEELLVEIQKFDGYDYSHHPNITNILIKFNQTKKKLNIVNKIPIISKLMDIINDQQLSWILKTLLAIMEKNSPNVQHIMDELENSTNDLELWLYGIIKLCGIPRKGLPKSIQIFKKIFANSTDPDAKHACLCFIKFVEKRIKKTNNIKFSHGIYEISSLFTDLSPNASAKEFLLSIFQFLSQSYSWIPNLIKLMIKSSKKDYFTILKENHNIYLEIINDLPFLNMWRIRSSKSLPPIYKYYARTIWDQTYDNYNFMHERGIIISKNTNDPSDQKLYNIHSLIEGFIVTYSSDNNDLDSSGKTNKSSNIRHYFQEMYEGSKYFMIKDKKYTLKRYLALNKILILNITINIAYQMFVDIINALYILKELKIRPWFIYPNMIQLSSIDDIKFGLCKFKYADYDSMDDIRYKSIRKNLPYIPPEIIYSDSEKYNTSSKACLYGLGCCLIQVLCKSLKSIDDPHHDFEKFISFHDHSEHPEFSTYKCKIMLDSIGKMIQKNPNKKPALEEVYELVNPKVKKSNYNNKSFVCTSTNDRDLDPFTIQSDLTYSTKKSQISDINKDDTVNYLIKTYHLNEQKNNVDDQFRHAIKLLKLLDYLEPYHKQNKFYGNIQPKNIKIKENGDFALINPNTFIEYTKNEDKYSISLKNTQIEPNIYMAPELVNCINEKREDIFDDPCKADIYSIGACIFHIFYKHDKFQGNLKDILLDDVWLEMSQKNELSPNIKILFELIKVMIEELAEDRFTINEIKKCLSYLNIINLD